MQVAHTTHGTAESPRPAAAIGSEAGAAASLAPDGRDPEGHRPLSPDPNATDPDSPERTSAEQPVPDHRAAARRSATTDSPAPDRFAGIVRRIAALVPVVASLVMLAYAVHGGMSVVEVVRAAIVVLVTQVLPGLLVWRSVRPRDGWWLEDLAIGFAVGSVIAIGAQVVAGLTEQTWLSWSPVLVAILFWAIPATRVRILTARTRPLPWWFSASVGALFLVTIPQLRSYFRQAPLSWAHGRRTPHVDAYLHLSLVDQLAYRGPTTFPWVKSESLYYHWFSHAWVAQIGVASHDALDATLFRFMPVVVPIAVVLAMAVAAVRLTGRLWTGPVAAMLALIGGDLVPIGIQSPSSPIDPLSPSLGLAMPMMIGVVLVLALTWKRAMRPGGLWLLPVLCIGASGTKGSTLPLIVAGLGVALVGMIAFNRAQIRRIISDLVIVGACLIFTLIVIFAGSGEGLHLSLTDAARETPVSARLGPPHTLLEGALALGLPFLGVLTRGAAGFALPFSRKGRRDPLTWLLLGGSVAGAGAIVVFAHPGLSQWYFARTAEPLLALASVVGLAALIEVIDPGRRIAVFVLGAVAGPVLIAAGPVLLGPLTSGAWRRAYVMLAISVLVLVAVAIVGAMIGRFGRERWLLAGTAAAVAVLSAGLLVGWGSLLNAPVAPLPNAKTAAFDATSRNEIVAARWIRDHSGINDLVMTNRHCARPVAPDNCDDRWFVVTAFSERQVLVESWTATPESAKLGPRGRENQTVNYWHPDLLALNDAFIASPTASAAAQLKKLGVKWIYVDHTRPYASTLEPYAKLMYRNPGVDVYEFTGA
jgi:hypothetical protein